MSVKLASDRATVPAADGHIDRPIGLRFVGDWGGANLTRVCGWLAHELHDRSGGIAHSTIRTGDAGVGNLRALGRGEVDVAVVTPSAVGTLAVRGEGPFAGEAYPHLRALGELPHPDRLLFALRADLGVSSFAELRQAHPPLRLATALDTPGGSFAGYAVERLLAAAGVAPETLREWGGEVIAHDLPPACIAELAEGGADAVLHEAVMMSWWQDVAERRELTYLPFEPDVLAVAERELACPPTQLPKGFLPGLDRPVETVEFRGYLVLVREEMARDLAHLLTWVLAETATRFVAMNYSHLPAERSPIDYPIEREGLADTPIALHPGAADYYQRAAVGTPGAEER